MDDSARRAHHDYFTAMSKEADAANADCKRAYGIWCDAAERVKRIEAKRHEAWLALVGTYETRSI